MTNKIYYSRTGLTGGTTNLDGIDGANLNDKDIAYVSVSGVQYIYILDAYSGATESSPYVITPDSNPGTKRWIRKQFSTTYATTYLAYSITSQASDIDTVLYNLSVVESGAYWVTATCNAGTSGSNAIVWSLIKVGNSGSNYASATTKQSSTAHYYSGGSTWLIANNSIIVLCNANDIIYHGCQVFADSGTRQVIGDNTNTKPTQMVIFKVI
jgi:hypothetical protein